jgi:hypothetical protein
VREYKTQDTISTGNIKQKYYSEFHFCLEREQGTMESVLLKTLEDTNYTRHLFYHSVQVTEEEYVGGGNIVSYPEEANIAGHIYLAKIKTAATNVIEEDIETNGLIGYLWIFNSYPNPVRGQMNMNFYCSPRFIDEMIIEIYDNLGRKFDIPPFEIMAYNTENGRGKLSLDLSSLPKGPKYLMLKTNGDYYTQPIMVY